MQYNSRKLNLFYKKREIIIIIRPLLVLNRLQILKICNFWRLPIYIDSTNKLINFRRNRLRHQILPLFKAFFNPKIDIALTRFISIINYENDYFKNHLKNISKFIKTKQLNSKKLKKIQNLKLFTFLPSALQKKFYKQLLISHFKSLSFNEIEFLLKVNTLLFK